MVVLAVMLTKCMTTFNLLPCCCVIVLQVLIIMPTAYEDDENAPYDVTAAAVPSPRPRVGLFLRPPYPQTEFRWGS